MTTHLGTIRPKLLSDLAYDNLLADIVAGRLQPGLRLNLDDLAEQFGISRTPVREALQRLSVLGFVEIARNARTTVANWGAEGMRDRAHVLGAVAYAAASSPSRAETRIGGSDPGDEPPVLGFLTFAEELVVDRFPAAGTGISRDIVGPLRQYLVPRDVKSEADHESSRFAQALEDAIAAVRINDVVAARDRIQRCSQFVLDALVERGPSS